MYKIQTSKTKQSVIRVLIADDQPQCHEALELALSNKKGIVLCGSAMDGEEMVGLIAEASPDVIITDIQMPNINGIEATKIIKELYPDIKILALTQFSDEDLIVKMMQAGANGYILKNEPADTLAKAIQSVNNGKTYFCESTNHRLLRMILKGTITCSPQLPPGFFAANEKEILIYVCQQYSSKQIAAKLGIAHTSVEKYRQRLFKKTGSQNVVGLVMFAITNGIYQL